MKIISPFRLEQTTTLKPLKRYNAKLCISTCNSNIIIQKTDILFLKSDSNYCEIHLNDGESHFCSKTMKVIHTRIQNSDFIKVHKSYVINFNGIKSIDSTYTFLTLVDDTQVPIARARKVILKEFIGLKFD